MNETVIRPALVVMAAGLGSRFGGLKQLEPVGVGDEIILEYSVHDAIKAGFGRVVFIINEKIEEEFKERVSSRIPSSIRCDYCIQDPNNIPAGVKVPPERKKPWGTGQAVMSLKGVVSEPFAVINADDYYGAEAYKLLFEQLSRTHEADGVSDYCMVGYGVANTLSENGTVARGICEVGEDGFLRGVTERTKIMRRGGDVCYTEDGESWTALPEDSVASMNCWGFTPDAIDKLAEGFPRFFEENAGRLDKAEYFLPEFVSRQLKEGKARVKVLTTSEGCCGVTYREDLPKLRARIAAFTEAGKYSAPLWKNLI
ncbi:MAG: NTP transferase domain-containing protein [Clostridia bacterium]|nr:NTP transferase domain-containing protein [Clostridia bacterium]